jgi:hypothetical protein
MDEVGDEKDRGEGGMDEGGAALMVFRSRHQASSSFVHGSRQSAPTH